MGAICPIPLLYSRVPISPRGEYVHVFDTPVVMAHTSVFVAVAQGTPFDYLTLVVSRAYVH